MTHPRSIQKQAFLDRTPWGDCPATLVAGDASNRRYDRLTAADGRTAILMDAPPDKGEDVRPFVAIASHLTQHGFSAPEIYHQDTESGFLLIEDLGDDLFARLMADDPDRITPLYTAATDVLIALHKTPPPDIAVCDADWLCSMADLAFEWYAPTEPRGALRRFDDVFRPLAQSLDRTAKVIILRDYHAENLLWLPARDGVAQVGLLDFQDALLGHPAYDLVSVLQDARRDVHADVETAMIAHYTTATHTDIAPFQQAYAVLGAQRNLRILGIFARLCQRDGKAHYVDMIPRVWGYLMRNLTHPDLGGLARLVHDTLPPPTPELLQDMKSKCATRPTP